MGTEGDKRRAILLCVCIACILIGLSFFVLSMKYRRAVITMMP